MKKITLLLPSLLLALASMQATAQDQVGQPQVATPASIPGDAYWNGGTGAAAAAPAPSADSSIPGDAYWGGTVGPSLSPNAIWAESPSQVNADAVFSNDPNGENEIPLVRANLIQEAAIAFGAQAGMASRTRELNNAASQRSFDYDRTFRFADLMIEPGFMAPVVTEGRDAYQQPNAREVRVADRIYRIEIPERLVSTPPRWQEYLLLAPSAPLAPDRLARPRNKAERAWWDRWALVGWERGVAQADQSFSSRLARLRRDFEGMVRFKSLYQQGVITMPILAKSNLGVTGGGDEMAINDRIYRITEEAKLDPNTGKWRRGVPITHRTDLPEGTKPEPTGQPRE